MLLHHHHPLLYDSNPTKASLIASVMSNNTSRSCIGPSHVSEMRLKLSKRASGGNAPGLSSKTGGHVKHWTTNVYGQRAQERVLEEEAPQVSETTPSIKIFPGQAFPLGVSEVESGINFAIFSQHASAVTLCLSFPERWDGKMMELTLDPHVNKTGDIWHICIEVVLLYTSLIVFGRH
nr:isoamylase 3, chloroplastic-like [Quercus suber]